MNIENRGNGHWRVRQTINGINYQVSIDYKPTQKEALYLLQDKIKTTEATCKDEFFKCCKAYIDSKRGTATPNTLRTYTRYLRQIPNAIKKISIAKINNINLQFAISEYSKKHSPKTTKSFYGFISSVLKAYTDKTFRIQLPKIQKSEPYIPTLDVIQTIMHEIKNTDLEPIFILCCFGLRIGEALCITTSDILDDCVIVNKTLSINEKSQKIIQAPKTYESNRRVPIPTELLEIVKNSKCKWLSYRYYQQHLYSIQDKLQIPHFSFHKLRHFFCSYCLNELHLSEKEVLRYGGWATNNCMNAVYNHTLQDKPITIPLIRSHLPYNELLATK